jgi:hypothetical protein
VVAEAALESMEKTHGRIDGCLLSACPRVTSNAPLLFAHGGLGVGRLSIHG